jgi:hypothetical protein
MNNETFGVSCEIALCKLFKSKTFPNEERGNAEYVKNLIPEFKNLFEKYKSKIKFETLDYTGEAQNKVDFKDNNNKTYSLKSNLKKSTKVCPQVIGQCTRDVFRDKVYSKITKTDDPDYFLENKTIKEFILKHPKNLFSLYLENLFCCDYVLYVKQVKPNKYDMNIIDAKNIKFNEVKQKIEIDNFTFTKTIDNWNESATMKVEYKIDDKKIVLSIGEYQIHNNRNCIKFRFDLKNLLKYLQDKNLFI